MKVASLNRLFLAVACGGWLSGCMVGPDFQRPQPPAAERFTTEPLQLQGARDAGQVEQHLQPGQALSHDWWQLFHSEALDGVVRQALAGNQSLAAATASLAQAQELADAKAGTRSPQVDLTAGVGRQKYGAKFFGSQPGIPPFTYFAIGPTVSYTLDYTGGVARSIEQQRALADYQQRQRDAAELAVTGNAVTQALRIASLRAQIDTVEALLERDRENLKLVQLAFDAGSVSRLDIFSAQSQLATDMTQLPPLRQELSQARHALAIILGQTPAAAGLPEFDLAHIALPDNLPVSVPSETARRRPDILAAEAQLHAATAAVGVAEGNLYPHIDLTASLDQESGTTGQLFKHGSSAWSLGGGLVMPLLDGGTLRAEKRAAVDAMQASAANYQQTVLEAFGQVADSLQALEHGSEQLQAEARAQDSAQQNADLTRRSYKEGNVGILQVLDAERRYQQARLGFVKAQAQRYLDTVQLFLALGGAPQA